MVACLCFMLPAFAGDIYLMGNGNNMESDNVHGWGFPAAKISSDGDTYSFWVSGGFKLSTTSGADWNAFDGSQIWPKYNGNSAPSNGGNIDLGVAGKTNVTLTKSGDDWVISMEGGEIVIPADPENLYLTGESFGGWDPKSKTMVKDGDAFTYTATNGINGEWKIADGTWDWTLGQGESDHPVLGTEYSLAKGAGNLKSSFNGEVKIKVYKKADGNWYLLLTGEGGGGDDPVEPVSYKYYLHPWNGYDTDVQLVPGTEKVIENFKNCGFGIRVTRADASVNDQLYWYQASSDNYQLKSGENTYLLFKQDGDKYYNFSNELGDGNYGFTLTIGEDGMPTELKVRAPGGVTPPVTGDAYYLAASFLDNWGYRVKFEPTEEDANVLVAKATYGEGNPNNDGFKITTRPGDGGTWYSLGSSRLDKGVEYTIAGKTETPNMLLNRGAVNQEVTWTITLGADGKISTLKASWEGDNIDVTDDMPVYPIGVYDDQALFNYNKWPVMYLTARVLNDNVITPEYQFTQVAADRYELEFTMRPTKVVTGGDPYENDDTKLKVKGFNNASSPIVVFADYGQYGLDKKFPKDGARMKAICRKGADGKWTLTLEEVGFIEDMPFLSMVSENWKQRAKLSTPHGNHTTDEGWQEAWIQYDSRGNIALNRKGEVMYNTMWPPRNPILFKTEFEVGGEKKDFTLTSKDLTFKKVGKTKTGKEWKEDPLFAEYTKTHLGETKEYLKALALDDNRSYTLYRVENMWISGKSKLWTGWIGRRNDTNGDAIWNNHSNWGHFGKSKNPTEIHAGATVPLFNEDGDMKFDKPTFFKYVDFFYDTEDPQGYGKSVLFTELSFGGAQIAALSTSASADNTTNSYEVGNYQASLAHVENVKNGVLKRVTINSFATRENGAEELISNVFNWRAAEGETKKNEDFYTIFNSKPSNDQLPGGGSPADGASTSKWVNDTYKYANGDYFYRMTVVLTDNDNKERTVIVDSNPFTIFQPKEELTLNVYQLVKIGDSVVNGVRVGEYYTFRGTAENPADAQLPVYKVTIENDDKFDPNSGNVTWEYDDNGNLVSGYIDDTHYKFSYESLTELPDYASSNFQFTDKILVVGSLPNANSVIGYKFGADNASGEPVETPEIPETTEPSSVRAKVGPMRAPVTEEWDRSTLQPEYGNRFMHVTNVGNFDEREFSLQMKYSTQFVDVDGQVVTLTGEETPTVSANYTAVIPEPELVDAKIEVIYGDVEGDGDEDGLMDFKFRGLDIKDARYHNVRDYIEVKYANVSTYMQERMQIRNFFTLVLDNSNNPLEDQKWESIISNRESTSDSLYVYTGDFMHPKRFSKPRKVRLEKAKGYQYYPRWGGDKEITQLEITDNAPIRMEISVANPKVYREETAAGETAPVISEFTFLVGHEEAYRPGETHDDYQEAMNDKHNYIFHTNKPDTFEHLRHHSEHDYYYVAVIDKNDADYAPGTDNESSVYAQNDTIYHFVVPATEMMKGAKFEIPMKIVGPAVANDFNTADFVGENFASKNYEVYISYLYPFNAVSGQDTPLEENAPANKPMRSVQDYSDVVLKSKARVLAATAPTNIVTSVDGISYVSGSVKTGEGWIEVEGEGVQIISMGGVVVAEGAGHHDVNPGVYVVRVNGRTEKVVVK